MHTPPSIPACERCNMRLAPHLTVRRKRDLFGDVRIGREGILQNVFFFFFALFFFNTPTSIPACELFICEDSIRYSCSPPPRNPPASPSLDIR